MFVDFYSCLSINCSMLHPQISKPFLALQLMQSGKKILAQKRRIKLQLISLFKMSKPSAMRVGKNCQK